MWTRSARAALPSAAARPARLAPACRARTHVEAHGAAPLEAEHAATHAAPHARRHALVRRARARSRATRVVVGLAVGERGLAGRRRGAGPR
eukprot:4769192-Prymnesium_polylepis.2